MKKTPLGKGKYVKAKTPEAKQKQTAAIIGYYTKNERKKNRKRSLGFCDLSAFSYQVKKEKARRVPCEITPKAWMESAACRGMESTRSVVWNQPQGPDGITATPCMASSRRGFILYALRAMPCATSTGFHTTRGARRS